MKMSILMLMTVCLSTNLVFVVGHNSFGNQYNVNGLLIDHILCTPEALKVSKLQWKLLSGITVNVIIWLMRSIFSKNSKAPLGLLSKSLIGQYYHFFNVISFSWSQSGPFKRCLLYNYLDFFKLLIIYH